MFAGGLGLGLNKQKTSESAKRKSEVFQACLKTGIACSEDPFWATLIEQMCGISVTVRHGAFAGTVGAASIGGACVKK